MPALDAGLLECDHFLRMLLKTLHEIFRLSHLAAGIRRLAPEFLGRQQLFGTRINCIMQLRGIHAVLKFADRITHLEVMLHRIFQAGMKSECFGEMRHRHPGKKARKTTTGILFAVLFKCRPRASLPWDRWQA